MRLIALEDQLKARKKMTINTALFFSVPIGLIFFLLTIGGGFFEAILFGLLVFAFLFGFIYFIREITHKGVDKRRKKLDLVSPHLEVLFKGEIGMLEFAKDALIYRTLTPGSPNKEVRIDIHPDLFLAVGPIELSKIQKLKHRGVEKAYILAKEMPSGLPRQFIFYNAKDTMKKVLDVVEERNVYEGK
jgi:hypothetical protein